MLSPAPRRIRPSLGPVVLSLAAGIAVLVVGMLVNSCQIDKLLRGGQAPSPAPPSPPSPPAPPPGASGTLEVTPGSLKDSALIGTREPRRAVLQIRNSGPWSATTDSAWISLAPATGTGPRAVTVTLNPEGLRAGSHDGSVTVNAPAATGSPVTVPVKFMVQQPILSVKPSSLSHTTESSNRRYYDTLDVRNDGNGPLLWTAANFAPWLSVVTTAGVGPGKLAVTMSTSTLPIGTHQDTIIVTSVGALRSPVRIPITLRRKHD